MSYHAGGCSPTSQQLFDPAAFTSHPTKIIHSALYSIIQMPTIWPRQGIKSRPYTAPSHSIPYPRHQFSAATGGNSAAHLPFFSIFGSLGLP